MIISVLDVGISLKNQFKVGLVLEVQKVTKQLHIIHWSLIKIKCVKEPTGGLFL